MVKKPMKAAGPLIFAAAIAAAVLLRRADRLHGACIARGQLACRCADVV